MKKENVYIYIYENLQIQLQKSFILNNFGVVPQPPVLEMVSQE
jgi:hypothetical protein